MIDFKKIKETDEDIYDLIVAEYERQQNGLELITSENRPSEAVLEAQGEKYA